MKVSDRFFLRLPVILYLYPTVALLFLRSENALFLGRYSLFIAALLLFSLLALFSYWASERLASSLGGVLRGFAYLSLYTLTIVSVTNFGFSQLPFITAFMVFERILIVFALLFGALELQGRKLSRIANTYLVLGVFFSVVPALDLSLSTYRFFAEQMNRPMLKTTDHSQERSDHQKARVERSDFRAANDGVLHFDGDYLKRFPFKNDDWVIIGDSFVWGVGVKPSETFSNRLNEFASKSSGIAVHALGFPGGGVADYLDLIRMLEGRRELGRIVLSFYLNDMPFDTMSNPVVQAFTFAIDRSSIGIQFLANLCLKFSLLVNPNLLSFDYYAQVVRNFDPKSFSFDSRWKHVEQHLREIHRRATEISSQQPVFLLLPLLEDYSQYRLEDAHSRLLKMAKGIGYETVDLYPVFKNKIGDGRKIAVKKDDIHFNAIGHEWVAETLRERFFRVSR